MKPKLDRDLIEVDKVEDRHFGYVYEVFLENSTHISNQHFWDQHDLLYSTSPSEVNMYEDGAVFMYETEFDLKRVWELD